MHGHCVCGVQIEEVDQFSEGQSQKATQEQSGMNIHTKVSNAAISDTPTKNVKGNRM